jgi:hypothetical protein
MVFQELWVLLQFFFLQFEAPVQLHIEMIDENEYKVGDKPGGPSPDRLIRAAEKQSEGCVDPLEYLAFQNLA